MTKIEPAALAESIAMAALEKLASDVRLIDLRGVVSYTDYFVVCTGQNARLTKAISDHVIDEMVEQGHRRPKRRESDPDGSWLLLDWGDCILHIFTPEARAFYRLESLWGQVPQTPVHDPAAAAPAAMEGHATAKR